MPVVTPPYSTYSSICQSLSKLEGFVWLRFPVEGKNSIELIGSRPSWFFEYSSATHHSPKAFIDMVVRAARISALQNPQKHPLDSIFNGGLLGYFSYEFGKEQVLGNTGKPVNAGKPIVSAARSNQEPILPKAFVGYYDQYLVIDHDSKVISGFVDSATSQLISTKHLMKIQAELENQIFRFTDFEAQWSPEDYRQAFNKLHHYIYSGDTYQVNLTQRFQARYEGDLWTAFIQVDKQTQAPHSAFMSLPVGHILSFSPENFLSIDQGKVRTKPIKGTKARHPDPVVDKSIANELQSSVKDRAENVMIVDLLRNDLGKIAKTGSVKVEKLCALESFSNVHHLVSTVCAELKEQAHPLLALLYCSPGGSITGAPKKRAMEIIDELEHSPRDVYCGNVFFCGNNGRLESNIAIRTMVCREGVAHLCGGGGIVADSECASEFHESLVKIRHIAKALGVDINALTQKKSHG